MYHYSAKGKDNKMKRNFLLTALISIIPFLFLVILLNFIGWEKITPIDYRLSHLFYNLHDSLLNRIMTLITHLGDVVTQSIVTIITVLCLFAFKKWRTGLWYGFTVLLGALFLNSAIKEFYTRARPSQIEPLVEIGGYSFPSGHSMGSIIVYGGILFIVLRSFRFVYFEKIIFAIFFLIIGMIGISRIYLGVHFPSDVIGGFSLGLSWLSFSIASGGLKYTNQEFILKNKYSRKKFIHL